MPCYYSKIRYCPKAETFNKETSIFEKYGSFIKKSANSDRVVKILKPQFAHHKKFEIQKHIDKVNNDQDKIDDYKDLLEFKPTDPSIIQQFLYDVWLYNKEQSGEDEPLAVFMPILCHRIASAIRIQSVYRGYLFTKRCNEEKQKSFNDQIVERRAVIFIQRSWQWYKIRQRFKALSDIKEYVNSINTNTLFIEQHLYLIKFKEVFIEFSFNDEYEA